ncbi:PREDICTED: josephin-like protein [Camelina sativa]|uniref:Josephin-like protein n=1 Tax=Camelina sativa TaxID=90675 RepID=A0ABM0XIF8_CAMSA|nr:PREDICTED: josephin-like protein [Camelina sativa]
MSRRACKRVSFNPNPEATDEPIFPKHEGLNSSHHSRRKVVLVGILSFGLRSSPAARKLIQRIGARVAKTWRFISFRRNTTDKKTSSFLLPSSDSSSSSSSTIYMKRSKSVNETESHRAEAIEDCIEFLNSSFSLSRSNSVSTWSS